MGAERKQARNGLLFALGQAWLRAAPQLLTTSRAALRPTSLCDPTRQPVAPTLTAAGLRRTCGTKMLKNSVELFLRACPGANLVISAPQRKMAIRNNQLPERCRQVVRHTSRTMSPGGPRELRTCPTYAGKPPNNSQIAVEKMPRQPNIESIPAQLGRVGPRLGRNRPRLAKSQASTEVRPSLVDLDHILADLGRRCGWGI